jgi:hypothetical protein
MALDALIEATNPVTAVLLAGIAWYLRQVRDDLRDDLQATRSRVERLESELIDHNGGEN